jgi:DNA-3-methyladenine glycosylase
VARSLLGTVLVHRTGDTRLEVRVVEVEAYVGPHDLACHAAKGRTKRTAVMFGPPGYAYVYLVYGMHHMFNVVTGPEGLAQAVLIRAAEPVTGLTGALNGPGRLTRALGITRQHDNEDLCGDRLFLRSGRAPDRVVETTRVGVEYAGEWADAPLRFYDADSPCVSRR